MPHGTGRGRQERGTVANGASTTGWVLVGALTAPSPVRLNFFLFFAWSNPQKLFQGDHHNYFYLYLVDTYIQISDLLKMLLYIAVQVVFGYRLSNVIYVFLVHITVIN